MSNTVITNYTDLNGPSSKADNSVVVIVNKDGSLSVDQNLLGTLMGTDGSQAAGISVVRVGHEGKPDDATDSETEDDKIPHVTLSVDSYYDEPNSILKYDSGAEMLQALRIETRENSLVGFHNDHCYTPLTSPSQSLPQRSDSLYDEPVIEITHTPPPKPVPHSKKITILEQKIIPKGKKIVLNAADQPVIYKGNEVLHKQMQNLSKSKNTLNIEKCKLSLKKTEENIESSSLSSSGDSIPDRDSDSDYRDSKDKSSLIKLRKNKIKPRILKTTQTSKLSRLDSKVASRIKSDKSLLRKELKEKIQHKLVPEKRTELLHSKEIVKPNEASADDTSKSIKQVLKPVKKEKKPPAHVTALLSDMASLFSTPDVIRRVSTDKTPAKDSLSKKITDITKVSDISDNKTHASTHKSTLKQTKIIAPVEKVTKSFDTIPQLDDVSLAQILQDTPNVTKTQQNVPSSNATINSPSLAGPLSPTLDLLGGLQPEEEGLTEDLLMHVAQLVESSENLQEVIDKQVLGKVDAVPVKATSPSFQQVQANNPFAQSTAKSTKTVVPRKDPIEIVRKDGRIIKLPPIEAPATRASKRKSQIHEPVSDPSVLAPSTPTQTFIAASSPESQLNQVSKQYSNKKLQNKKAEPNLLGPTLDKNPAESQESWNSEDDPYRLWCICKQPHNNRFMICCDSCEDWFHGKCVNITKAMGQQMEEQGIEWRCPNCLKKTKLSPKSSSKAAGANTGESRKSAINVSEPASSGSRRQSQTKPMPANTSNKKSDNDSLMANSLSGSLTKSSSSRTTCIVCKKPARASSIYCSDACILKHAQDSLGAHTSPNTNDPNKSSDKQKTDSRVIVYERKSGRLLAGPNAPTAENLKAWLQKNPTFEVVRPGTLSTIKPNLGKKPSIESGRIQTTLNFERIPKKVSANTPSNVPKSNLAEPKPSTSKASMSMREERTSYPKTPVTPKTQAVTSSETPRSSLYAASTSSEPKKVSRASNRSQSTYEKSQTLSPATTRRKDSIKERKTDSDDPIRDNVKKALTEQMTQRMTENSEAKFSPEEIRQFAYETEFELHELFRDVGMKYKAKYRSLMFNIKDRKNLSLWQKICNRSITPKQLVRLSPEELASQELAQWRDKESKYQLELIKKSELDLLAASKTYVLKTHKGEEVIENKESVSTELDPNVSVEDLVSVLNDSSVAAAASSKDNVESSKNTSDKKRGSSRKKDREDGYHKRSKKDAKRDYDGKKSQSSKRKSDARDKDEVLPKKSRKTSSGSKDKKSDVDVKTEGDKYKYRSRSRTRLGKSSKSRDHSRSTSQGRDGKGRSQSRDSSKRGSRSKNTSRRPSTRSKHRTSTEDKAKHRSKSQENIITKNLNESTDSDTHERPKSAMLKEAHPEYDPHEPMITSAFSEEDLRKSREDVFEDSFKNEFGDADYDPNKIFSIDSNVVMAPTVLGRKEKTSEAESDQEPTSTVDNAAATVWNGCINMVDVARFYVAAHEVSGSSSDLEEDLSSELDIVGRINPDTVWDYISKMKRASNKDIIILRLHAANDEEKMQYIALYSYLNSRNRLGVVKVSNTTTVKDFYIVPLPANSTLPPILLPFDGPGLGEVKTHLLLAIVIRQRKKRNALHIPKEIPAKVPRESTKRSYTPPTSPRRRQLPIPSYTSPKLSSSVKDKIAATLAADEEEAYSPGSSNSSGSIPASAPAPAVESKLRSKMEELNRQIEEQKKQILKMSQADSSVSGEDEAYSPSRPMTPPAVMPLADIALPSNLQEILANIKQRTETTADVDMRTLPPP